MASEYPPGTYYSTKANKFFTFETVYNTRCRFKFHDTSDFTFGPYAYRTASYNDVVSHLRAFGYTLVNQEIDEELLWE